MMTHPCEICFRVTGRMVLDHDHRTGKVRGVLCHLCNSGIGMFHDSPESLTSAADYVKRKSG